jgi:hypothetical protein
MTGLESILPGCTCAQARTKKLTRMRRSASCDRAGKVTCQSVLMRHEHSRPSHQGRHIHQRAPRHDPLQPAMGSKG